MIKFENFLGRCTEETQANRCIRFLTRANGTTPLHKLLMTTA